MTLPPGLISVPIEQFNLDIVHTNPVRRIVAVEYNPQPVRIRRHRLKGRPSRVPHPWRAQPAGHSHAPHGRLERVFQPQGALVRRGGVEVVVERDGVVLAGAGVHELEQGQRALAAIARMTRGEERGEGDSAAIVGAAGGGQGVGGLVADDADDVPSIAAGGWGCNARFKASIIDYGAGGAGCGCVER